MVDIFDIEELVEDIYELKKQSRFLKDLLTVKINTVKEYLKEKNKKQLKIKGFSLTLLNKETAKYNTRLLKKYIEEGKCPKDVIMKSENKSFLTITSIKDIELVGNKFIILNVKK
jgi:hypothetical protein